MTFDELIAEAARSGFLKFHTDGIAILERPPSPKVTGESEN